ncbi:hypothetical protein DER29_0461 [Micromonospora sp. M71_S20]|uniref:hypothetical protein n=1 Tax=Micromonospora sp. M71_S20 TaxID=592872 RepID=UPI000F25506E|nr:hypothetical protein [Micromonospora sp. M71_S20]RLK22624.1 hypothetical protein DER29_0461 [Micromonospora sp. M71_S20]
MTMDRSDALAVGMEVIEDADAGAATCGTSPERAAVALEIARFLVGADGYDEEADEETEEAAQLDAIGPLGALASVTCSVSPGDTAAVDAYQTVRGKRVRVVTTDSGNRHTIVLTPEDARRFAAGILNAADAADGTSGLSFGVGSPLS